ncbi:uncharacterized protein FYW47_001922 [Aplochiton taeniatus]
MCVNGPALRGVVVLLLLGVSYSRPKRRCNYTEILRSYRETISVELDSLNLSDTSEKKDSCPFRSEKTYRILRYIYDMTQKFRCLNEGGTIQEDILGRPVRTMEELIRQNCTHSNLLKKQRKPTCKKGKGQKKRMTRLVRNLMNCWKKLQFFETTTE